MRIANPIPGSLSPKEGIRERTRVVDIPLPGA